MSSAYPYAQTHDVIRGMPSEGRSRPSIIEELVDFARTEDAMWETGKCSGTMYCGDHTHYEFMGRAFELFAHVNALQRDMCPSMTKFEGEIIAMTLDMLHADAIIDSEPAALVTSGGSGSILHAVLAYREWAREQRGIDRPCESWSRVPAASSAGTWCASCSRAGTRSPRSAGVSRTPPRSTGPRRFVSSRRTCTHRPRICVRPSATPRW